jgi:hypothetical protein
MTEYVITLEQTEASVSSIEHTSMNEYIITLEKDGVIISNDISYGNPYSVIGFPGVSSPGSFPNEIIEQEITTAGENTINLTEFINMGILFINGIVQSKDSFTISGTTVNLPADLNLMVGDTIQFYY